MGMLLPPPMQLFQALSDGGKGPEDVSATMLSCIIFLAFWE